MCQYVQQWVVLNCCIISILLTHLLNSSMFFNVWILFCCYCDFLRASGSPNSRLFDNKETDRRKSRYQPYFWFKLHKEHGSGMQLFEIPKAVAGIKQNFPNTQTGLGNHSLPSEGKPSHKVPLQEAVRAYTLRRQHSKPPKSGIPSQAESISETLHTYYPTAEEGGTDILSQQQHLCYYVTGSNGITLFGLHFSLCKFFCISIGHFYFFSSNALICLLSISLVRASYSYSFVRCKRIQASCSS